MRSLEKRASRLERFRDQTLLSRLKPENQTTIERIFLDLDLSFQQLNQLTARVRDIEIWRYGSLDEIIRGLECGDDTGGILAGLERWYTGKLQEETVYPDVPWTAPPPESGPKGLQDTGKGDPLWGRCPVYSSDTVCCGLHTLDAVQGCPFGCSYCSVRTFYGPQWSYRSDLSSMLDGISLDPDRLYHFGTGQATDSLVWGNTRGILSDLFDFARERPNVLLELKTKADRVDEVLSQDVPSNVFCTWSLNTPTIIRYEETGTPNLERRLAAARRVADAGIRVGFHFHPMVHHAGWDPGYAAIADRVMDLFDAADVVFVSMGTVTLIKPVLRSIRRSETPTRITQMEMVPDPKGKLTYPDHIKEKMFSHLYTRFLPWHDDVLFYLCMEKREIWERSIGQVPPSNDAFESEMSLRIAAKLRG